MMHDQESIKFH